VRDPVPAKFRSRKVVGSSGVMISGSMKIVPPKGGDLVSRHSTTVSLFSGALQATNRKRNAERSLEITLPAFNVAKGRDGIDIDSRALTGNTSSYQKT
tara:strand:- start:175 stop:468 length:294 start_codon:yes stop_codon:yes gene_type:complete